MMRVFSLCALPFVGAALVLTQDGPTVIHAPNLDSDAIKADKAIDKYTTASQKTQEAWDIANEAYSVAPGMYPKRLRELIKAQDKSIEVLTKAHDAAGTAKDTANDEKDELEDKMNDKTDKLSEGRIGDDFEDEANTLKLEMR